MNPFLEKVKKVLREEDIEGYIDVHGAPDNEYDSEAQDIAEAMHALKDRHLTEDDILALIVPIWAKYFNLEGDELELRIPNLRKAAKRLMA